MKNLMELSPHTHHPQLAALITAYNQLDFNEQLIEKIFLLQKIDHLLETSTPDLELTSWRTGLGNKEQSSWESHLQRFGISRDGSTLVKNIQFAYVIAQNTPLHPVTEDDYFTVLQERNVLLAKTSAQIDEAELTQYIEYNQSIYNKFKTDPDLQQQYDRSQYFLSICYAKMEAIRGAVIQDFDTFETNQLGNRLGNNRNFKLNVEGEEKQLVIRVEDRNSLVTEQILQTYPVSEYFSEEYYMMMLPFTEGFEQVYRPVVLSEYVEQGSLDDYALTLTDLSPADLREKTQNIFLQLCDFCIKLEDAGHYHPDIKLSNFLTDGQTIKVSDRKNITDKKNPKADQILSTPTYSPPEYKACLNKSQTRVNQFQASKVTLDMPSFMSYQMGMALKEFVMATTMQIDHLTPEMFMEWMPVTTIADNPSRTQKNYFALVQELTRSNPQDRLPIVHFETLLRKVNLPHAQFLQEIEALSPQAELSNASDLALMDQLIHSRQLTPELRQKWGELEQKGVTNQLYCDPRNRFFEHANLEIKAYIEKVDQIIKTENRKKASSIQLIGSFLGAPLPEITKIEELPALPIMPDKIKWYFEILEELPTPMLLPSDIDKLRHIYMRQEGQHAFRAIASPVSKTSSLTTSPADSPNFSPIESVIGSPELEEDHDSRFDSGTFVRIPTKGQAQESSHNPLDSGTFVRAPTKGQAQESSYNPLDSGTFVRVPNKEQKQKDFDDDGFDTSNDDLDSDSVVHVPHKERAFEVTETRSPTDSTDLDTGSFVIRKPAPHAPNQDKNQQAYMKDIIKQMQDQEGPVEKQATSPKASDIDTTIKRGNRIK